MPFGSDLYVLYSSNEDGSLGTSSFLKRVDLECFDGDLREAPTVYARDLPVSSPLGLQLSMGKLIINGDQPEIIGLSDMDKIYSEAESQLANDWNPFGWLNLWDGKIYRGVDYTAPEKGVDIIDPVSRCILQRIGLDIPLVNVHGEFVSGLRQSGDLAIYSLPEQRYIYQAPLKGYRFASLEYRVAASVCVGGLAYVLAGDTLILIDLVQGKIVREINYLMLPALQAHIQTSRLRYEHACASGISVCGSIITVTLSSVWGYILCLDLSREDPYLWFWSEGRDVTALNCPGDLVYGLSNTVPMAWDKYSGEVVWNTAKPTNANRIQIGAQWVVFSQLSGYLKLFRWQKPYISPHHPAGL